MKSQHVEKGEETASDKSEAADNDGAGIAGAAAAAGATSLVRAETTNLILLELELADVASLDQVLILERLERITVKVVGGRLKVEPSADILELGELDSLHSTVGINGSTDGREAVEAINGRELGIVGDLETTSDLGELGEFDLGEGVV